MNNLIPADKFEACAICGRTKNDIRNSYPRRVDGAYYLEKFRNHLAASHGIGLPEYCEFRLGINWPRCPVTGECVGCRIGGKGLSLATYKKGAGVTQEMSSAFAASCERQRQARKGEGNPMFGKTPWNSGLAADDPYRAKMASLRQGIKEGPETSEKHRRNRAASMVKARHAVPHSQETKDLLRRRTAQMHKAGKLNRQTSIHLEIKGCLLRSGVPFAEEYCLEYYSIDFAIPEKKIAIEADGDYYHVNPALYPKGPRDAIQRRNAGNDAAKNAYLERHGWTIKRYWESDILSPGFEVKLKRDLVELGVLI